MGSCHIKTEKEFKEQLATIISVSPSSKGAVNGTDWLFFIFHYVCVCVFMCVRPLQFTPRGSTFSAAPSLKVVNEHRNTVGSHQVVGVSGESLVLPAFWVTCGQTDGGTVSDNSCFLYPAVMHFTSTPHTTTIYDRLESPFTTALTAVLDRIYCLSSYLISHGFVAYERH